MTGTNQPLAAALTRPPAEDADPGASDLQGAWVLAILVPLALLVVIFGGRRFQRGVSPTRLEPRGRRHASPSSRSRRRRGPIDAPDHVVEVARAAEGAVRVRGVLVNASERFGGTSGRECVYVNRSSAGPEHAVAADLLVLADASGRCGVEGPAEAMVDAPTEKGGRHDRVALYLGDEVEIVGHFQPEPPHAGTEPDARVYGTICGGRELAIRVVRRPDRDEPSPA